MNMQVKCLLFLATELLFLETDALVGKVLGEDSSRISGIANVLRKLGSTVSLIENIFSEGFEILEMSSIRD